MKTSTIVGGAAGTLTTLVGLGAAIFMPVIGLVAGAVAVHGAIVGTMGTAATVALTAAGGVGGLFIGQVAAPIAAWGAVGLGGVVGGVVKLLGSAVEKVTNFFKSDDPKPAPQKPAAQPAPRAAASVSAPQKQEKQGGFSLKALFGLAKDGGKKPANENKPAAPKDAAPAKKTGGPGI
ncbi:MAG: hypothetical protein GC185_08040 [Alphaproteobacteria bacterium]|nr:hypothetical protein [Alphaproteobacteria bacterium]